MKNIIHDTYFHNKLSDYSLNESVQILKLNTFYNSHQIYFDYADVDYYNPTKADISGELYISYNTNYDNDTTVTVAETIYPDTDGKIYSCDDGSDRRFRFRWNWYDDRFMLLLTSMRTRYIEDIYIHGYVLNITLSK